MKSRVRSAPLCRVSWVPGERKWKRRLGSKTEGRPGKGWQGVRRLRRGDPVPRTRGPGRTPAGPHMRQAVPPEINTLQEQICALGSLKRQTEQNEKHRSREGEDKGWGRREASEWSAEVHKRRFISFRCGTLISSAAVRGTPDRGAYSRNLLPHSLEAGSPRSQLVKAAVSSHVCLCVSSSCKGSSHPGLGSTPVPAL